MPSVLPRNSSESQLPQTFQPAVSHSTVAKSSVNKTPFSQAQPQPLTPSANSQPSTPSSNPPITSADATAAPASPRSKTEEGWISPWWGMLGLLVALWMWNWVLVLALAIALVTGVGVYLHQIRRLYVRWLNLTPLWRQHRPLWIALLAGVSTSGLAYLMVEVWRESSTPWLTAAVTVQGLGTLVALGAIASRFVQAQRPTTAAATAEQQLNEWLSQLTDGHAVKRLIAVRQLVSRISSDPAFLTHLSLAGWRPEDLQQCVRLMLKHESDPLVRQALKEAVIRLHTPALPPSSAEPVSAQRNSRRRRSPVAVRLSDRDYQTLKQYKL